MVLRLRLLLIALAASFGRDGGVQGVKIAQFLRSPGVSIAAGSAGLSLLVANRLATDAIFNSQSRSDLIAAVGAGTLLLCGLAEQDVSVREAERVALEGFQGRELAVSGPRAVLSWVLDSGLNATPATSVHVLWDGRTLARGGIVGDEKVVDPKAPIIKKAMSPLSQRGGEVHLPDLQILPGKVEFTYLPRNCQTVFIVPLAGAADVSARGAVVFGGDQARRFTPRDLSLLRNVAVRIEPALLDME